MSYDKDIKLLGEVKEKLIRRKQEWAAEGRLLTGRQDMADRTDRLPPGQRLTKDWPVLDLGVQPEIPKDLWSLTIDGLVDSPVRWDWDTFMDQPQFDDVSDIHCVTTWSRYDNYWQGVSSAHVLEVVKPKPEATHIVLHSFDGYTTNVTREAFSAADVLIAHSWEGNPIPRQHGGPARLVMPQYYFWKSAKWLKRIEFVAMNMRGFWEVRGYHNEGDPWKEERYSHQEVD